MDYGRDNGCADLYASGHKPQYFYHGKAGYQTGTFLPPLAGLLAATSVALLHYCEMGAPRAGGSCELFHAFHKIRSCVRARTRNLVSLLVAL